MQIFRNEGAHDRAPLPDILPQNLWEKSTGAIEEVDFENGKVIDIQLIRHHFDIDSFCPFGFLDDFSIPTAWPGISTQ